MKVFDFTVGRNKRVVKTYLHDDLSSVCDSVESHPVMIVCPGGADMHLSQEKQSLLALSSLQGATMYLFFIILLERVLKQRAL